MTDTYPLASLLALRRYREDEALRNVTRAKEAFKDAETVLESAENDLSRWEQWASEEKDRRYQRLIGRPTTVEALDVFNRSLADLAAETLHKKTLVNAARTRCDDCKRHLEEAQFKASTARRNTAKMQTHYDLWKKAAKRAAEHAEDLEFEDFQSGGPLSQRSDD